MITGEQVKEARALELEERRLPKGDQRKAGRTRP
jgi:hypothetical protein